MKKTATVILAVLAFSIISCNKNDSSSDPNVRLKEYRLYTGNSMVAQHVNYYQDSRITRREDSVFVYGNKAKDCIYLTKYDYQADQSVVATNVYLNLQVNPPDTFGQWQRSYRFNGNTMTERIYSYYSEGQLVPQSKENYDWTGTNLSGYSKYEMVNGEWVKFYEGQFIYASQNDTFKYYNAYQTFLLVHMIIIRHPLGKVTGVTEYHLNYESDSLVVTDSASYHYSSDGRIDSIRYYSYYLNQQQWEKMFTEHFSYSNGVLKETALKSTDGNTVREEYDYEDGIGNLSRYDDPLDSYYGLPGTLKSSFISKTGLQSPRPYYSSK